MTESSKGDISLNKTEYLNGKVNHLLLHHHTHTTIPCQFRKRESLASLVFKIEFMRALLLALNNLLETI
jgi:hypothetical protein